MKITPVQKQTRAGQRTRFKAFVVVGDGNGHVGLGVKCSEVASAIHGASSISMYALAIAIVSTFYTGAQTLRHLYELLMSTDLDKEERGSLKSGGGDDSEENEFLLEEYESEEEGACGGGGGGKVKRKACGRGTCSSSSDEEEENGGCFEEVEKEFKVYFCSRTHSQLSQFVKELRKTVFDGEVTVVCLGSRKNFCINEGIEPILVM